MKKKVLFGRMYKKELKQNGIKQSDEEIRKIIEKSQKENGSLNLENLI